MLLLSRLGANLAVLLSLLALVVTVYSNPRCIHPCKYTEECRHSPHKHVSNLRDSSVASWDLIRDQKEGREPDGIFNAVCNKCINNDMDAKPIFLQIIVCERIRSDTSLNSNARCKCPYKLAVGCTCVMKKPTGVHSL